MAAGLEGAARWLRGAPGDGPSLGEAAAVWQPLYRRVQAGGLTVLEPRAALRSIGPAWTVPADKGGLARIVVHGESSGDILAEALHDLADSPASGLQILNAGVVGGTLEEFQRRSSEVFGYSPDALIVVFGHNLFWRGPRGPMPLYLLRVLARRSRVVDFLLDRSGPRRERSPDGGSERLLAFRAELRELARRGRASGVSVVFCTMPSNLRFPPRSAPAERADAAYLEAAYERERGHLARARALLEKRLAQKETAWWDYELARLYERAGRYGEARSRYERARDLDPEGDRASRAVNDLIREAAREDGAQLLDLEAQAERDSPHAITGWTQFLDAVHVNGALADEQARSALDLLGLGARLGAPAARGEPRTGALRLAAFARRALRSAAESSLREALADKLAAALAADAADARRQVRSLLAQPPPSRLGEARTRAVLCASYAEAAWRLGRRQEALRFNGLAARLAPRWAGPALQKGRFLLGAGRCGEAAGQFRLASELEPSRADARFLAARSAADAAGPRCRL